MIERTTKKKIREKIPSGVWSHMRYIYRKIFRAGYFAKNDIDRKLTQYLDYDNGFFIELGANDGFSESNTLAFENKRGWRGILIEPAPNLFLTCCEYRSKPGNYIYCNACVPFDYKDKYVDIEYGNLMTASTSLDLSLEYTQKYKDKAKIHLNKFSSQLRFGAEAKTLTSIMDDSNAPECIDLLSLDVEGAELAVLAGIDFERYSFKYLVVETSDPETIEGYLRKQGYSLVENLSNHDYLFTNFEG